EGGQVAWWWRRRLEVADVAGVAVERRVQGQGAAVEAEDPECEAEERRLPGPGDGVGVESDGEEVADQGVRGHDRPLRRPQVEDVAERVAGGEAVAEAAPGVQRARPGHLRRPIDHRHGARRPRGGRSRGVMRAPFASRWRYAMSRPNSVRNGSMVSTLRQCGATRVARPPVATTSALFLPHSALMRRTIPSTASTAL